MEDTCINQQHSERNKEKKRRHRWNSSGIGLPKEIGYKQPEDDFVSPVEIQKLKRNDNTCEQSRKKYIKTHKEIHN